MRLPATLAADAPLFATRSPARDNNSPLRRSVPVLPESASRGQPSGLCNPDPIKHAAVLGPIKTKPCGGRARRGQP